MTSNELGHNEALTAIAKALDHFRQGQAEKGQSWLQYAQRRAPSSRHVSLAIGVARVEIGDPRASEPLELLAKRDDLAEAWFQLARTRLRFGNADQAASELQMMLSRHVYALSAYSAAVIDTISSSTGALGWCVVSDAKRRVLSIAGEAAEILAQDRSRLSLECGAGRPVAHVPAALKVKGYAVRQTRLHWDAARPIRLLHVKVDGRPLLGSPLDLSRMTRSEGFVEADRSGGIRGWCWYPGDLARQPRVVVQSLASGRRVTVTARDDRAESPPHLIVHHRSFVLPAEKLQMLGPGPVSVAVMDGAPLYGSPLDPGAEQRSVALTARSLGGVFPLAARPPSGTRSIGECWSGVPAEMIGPPPNHPRPAQTRGVDIVIPIYRGLDVTLACIESVIRHAIPQQRVLIIVDASPEPDLVVRLAALDGKDGCVVQLETVNRGFTATANIGLRMTAGRDAVLLNSDTVVTPGWLDGLRDAVHGATDIGTATPFSNDATIFSYPTVDSQNPLPRGAELVALSQAVRTNAGVTVDVPTGHGFCMYIRAECLEETGVLREDVFAQGYGEENDFSLRARHLGWRSVAVPSVFVAHVGSQSFGAAKDDLVLRNGRILNILHFGFDALVQRWLKDDPLYPFRRKVDIERFRSGQEGQESVLLVCHDREGGVRRHVLERAAAYEAKGMRALIATPVKGRDGRYRCAIDQPDAAFPNLGFALPQEASALHEFLRLAAVSLIDIHHTIGHDWALIEELRQTGLATDIYVHDYAWFCPRITLTNAGDRYCGEPNLEGCAICITDYGGKLGEEISPKALVERSQSILGRARRVIAPSSDAAKRIGRRFNISVIVEPWEDVPPWLPTPGVRASDGLRRIAVIGAIGLEKGYSLLLSLARAIAKQKLPIEFRIVGFTCDDKRLLDTGVVSITGRYEEKEALDLIRSQNADFAFLPALWPETWSYVLTQAWAAGLNVLAFDIGAQAQRIRDTGYGTIIPLGISEPQILRSMMSNALFQPAIAAA